MGRQKAVPTKLNPEHYWNLGKPLDYIPVKKRKNKKKIKANKTYELLMKSKTHEQFHLGEICIGTSSNILPENWSKAAASFVTTEENEENLILELDSTTIIVKILLEKKVLKDIIASKVFAVNIFTATGDIYLDLYFVNLPLPKFNKTIAFCIQTIFALLFNIRVTENDNEDELDQSRSTAFCQLYDSIKQVRERNLKLTNENVQHFKLKPKLRPYQENAVRWMLHRENKIYGDDDELNPLYTAVKLKSGIDIYYDKYSGYVQIDKPVIEKTSKGGILADEMGLGKTVEVLACILLNPKEPLNEDDHVYCEKSPTITKTNRKRKIEEEKMEKTASELVDEPKKLKISDSWVKGSSKKPQTRVALEMWYNSCLTSVNQPNLSPKVEIKIQCICGQNTENNCVVCKDCGKIQHVKCMSYEGCSEEYRCPQCWKNQPLVESGATLIVIPTSLRAQWCKEICKHVKGDFKVLRYEGCSTTPLYPTELIKYDVVITTYNVLEAELRLSETENEKTFRNKRRYSPPGCPLTRIKWWRLCLDEAQTVQTPTSMISEMAKKLDAHFRWAITGTPISKRISELQGLIDYLHIEPYNDKFTWEHVLFDPYLRGQQEPMLIFLSEVLWRSSKDETIKEINIPQQTVEEHWLEFSAVEQYFYNCEHQLSRNAFLEKTKSYDPNKPLESLDKCSLKRISVPLLSLRRVCTYPNSVRTRYLATKKPVNSMKDLLEALIAKNNNELDEYLRFVLSSLNGLAGIALLLQCPNEAVEEYRKVLQLYTRFTEEEKLVKLNVDKLQIIHTMHNLAEVLEIFGSMIDNRTLRDENLRKDCDELEEKYISRFINQTMTVLQECLLIDNTVEKLRSSFIFPAGKWYSDILDWIYVRDYRQDLFTRIDKALSVANVKSSIDFRSDRILIYSIAVWDENISELRKETINAVNNLYTYSPEDEFAIKIDQELVQTVTNCHLRPQKKPKVKKKCPLCVANDHLKAYELKLFSMAKRSVNFEEMSLKGSWKPTTEELIFKSILAVARTKNANNDFIKDGEVHINLIETLKKEFKEIRKLWTYLDQQICAQDELDICKIRLRLKEPDEKDKQQKRSKPSVLKNLTYQLENRVETIHVLEEHELGYQRSVLANEERHNMARLEKKLGVRSYLETLRQQQHEDQTLDPCPICKNTLEQHWSIIPCGHSYCLDCIQFLIEQSRGHHVHCSVCRAYHLVNEISYIRSGTEEEKTEDKTIKGLYSTKVESIVKLVLELISENEKVKVLVFSSWISVLKYFRTAFTNNNITTEMIGTSNLEKHIENFKDPERNITVLLLPMHLGGKGLNLIEATHVILAEPVLNPGDELQAIGRVHRIGQTKPTVVHKFFIKNTIEENIYKAVNTEVGTWWNNKINLKHLIDLFVDSSTEEIIRDSDELTSEN